MMVNNIGVMFTAAVIDEISNSKRFPRDKLPTVSHRKELLCIYTTVPVA